MRNPWGSRRSWARRAGAAAVAGAVLLVGSGGGALAATASDEHAVAQPLATGAPDTQVISDVAFNGSVYLAVWRSFGSQSTAEHQIYGTRITPSGQVLDPQGIPISTAPDSQSNPTVASVDGDFLVLWDDRRFGPQSDIYGSRVTGAGVVLDPDGVAFAATTANESTPQIEATADGYFAAWRRMTNTGASLLEGTRLDADGTILDPAPITVAPVTVGDFDLATNGTDFFAAWSDMRPGPNLWDVYGTRIESDGTVLDPTGIPISIAASNQQGIAVGSDGGQYLVTWGDTRSGAATPDVYGSLVALDGSVGAEIPISTATGPQSPGAVGFDGSNFIVAWSDRRSTSNDVYLSRVDADGTVLDPTGVPVVTVGNTQEAPAIAFDGTNSFLTWQDGRISANGFDIYGARVNTAGQVVDPSGILLSTGFGAQGTQTQPAIGFDGTNHLVAWREDRGAGGNIYAGRSTPAGATLDGSGLAVSTAAGDQSAPAVAYGGSGRYLVAWEDRRGATADVYASVVTGAGQVLNPTGLAVSAGTGDQTEPSVAFDGTNFVVAWTDTRSGEADIYGARVTTAGAVLDAAGIPVSTATGAQRHPAAAGSIGGSLVAWDDGRDGAGEADVYAARVAVDGSVLDAAGIAVSVGAADTSDPAVGWDGSQWFVAWADDRSGTSLDVYGTNVSPAGVTVDPAGNPIAVLPGDQDTPAVTFDVLRFVAWRDRRSLLETDIYGTALNYVGQALTPNGSPMAAGPGDEGRPSLSASAPHFPGSYGFAYERISDDPVFGGAPRVWMRTYTK